MKGRLAAKTRIPPYTVFPARRATFDRARSIDSGTVPGISDAPRRNGSGGAARRASAVTDG
jgi:hypothetical protein